jgi:hypothetical protein
MKYVDLLDAIKYKIEGDNKLYPLQKQIILKLLATIELVLDNDFRGEIKLDKDLLHIEEN